jgi:hypothetical protein
MRCSCWSGCAPGSADELAMLRKASKLVVDSMKP